MWVRDRDGNSLGWATACFAEIRPRNNAPKVATELPRILACSPVCKGKIEVLQAQLLLDYPGEAGEHHARFAGRVEHVAFYLAGGRFPVLGHPGSLPSKFDTVMVATAFDTDSYP